MNKNQWKTFNPGGSLRVIVTKELPGKRWLAILKAAVCRVEICTSPDILSVEDIKAAMGTRCDGAIGQLTENWGEDLFAALKGAGGVAYSNYAVGFNNVDLDAATKNGIPVGNTPGVLTEATAEHCVALAFAAARRIPEADVFMRGSQYRGWLPTLFIGELFWGKTVGVIGMGRIGLTFAKMMAGACHMNVAYYDPHCKLPVAEYFKALSDFFVSQGEEPITCTCCDSLRELCQSSDLISINTILNDETLHMIDAQAPLLDEGQRGIYQCRPGPGDGRGRFGGARQDPPRLQGRFGRVRGRTGHEARPGRTQERGHSAPHRLGHGLFARGNGHLGCQQRGGNA